MEEETDVELEVEGTRLTLFCVSTLDEPLLLLLLLLVGFSFINEEDEVFVDGMLREVLAELLL